MDAALESACGRYQSYLDTILRPAARSFRDALDLRRPMRLHEAFGVNLFTAHAVDYLVAIRHAAGSTGGRGKLVRQFDEVFFVEGARLQNAKFVLVDAVNNALKHIEIQRDRYQHLIAEYGPISFQCLAEVDGRVLCFLERYRFDYCRVALRPVLDTLVDCDFEGLDDVASFARGEWGQAGAEVIVDDFGDVVDDPIDQMIAHCNPLCDDCGEGAEDCVCSTFIYSGQSGEFAPLMDESFDFDAVMSRISGAYRAEG